MGHIYYLTPSEITALEMLAEGHKGIEVYTKSGLPAIGLTFTRADLMKKTGISRIIKSELHHFKQRFSEAKLSRSAITDRHFSILWDLFGGAESNFQQAASRFNLEPSSISTIVEHCSAIAGIFTKDQQTRRFQWKMFFALFCSPSDRKQPKGNVLFMLERFAAGEDYQSISDALTEKGGNDGGMFTPTMVQTIIRENCHKLELSSRGQGTQRRMVLLYLEHLNRQRAEAEAAPTMDDPAF